MPRLRSHRTCAPARRACLVMEPLEARTLLSLSSLSVVNGNTLATFSRPALSEGTHTITAVYVSSNGDDQGSSGTLTQTVPSTGGAGTGPGASTSGTALAPGVYVSGTVLYVIGGANTNDTVTVSPAVPGGNGSTGLVLSGILDDAAFSQTLNQAFGSIEILGGNGNNETGSDPGGQHFSKSAGTHSGPGDRPSDPR